MNPETEIHFSPPTEERVISDDLITAQFTQNINIGDDELNEEFGEVTENQKKQDQDDRLEISKTQVIKLQALHSSLAMVSCLQQSLPIFQYHAYCSLT